MSQISTIYRVSKEEFKSLENSGTRNETNLEEISKEFYDFNGSFLGLEYLLTKLNNDEIILEIFNFKNSLGQDEYDKLDFEQQFEYYESGKLIPYLNQTVIKKLNIIFDGISEDKFSKNYNADELNANDIYPNVWNNDNSEDRLYNLRQLLEDFKSLKKILKNAHNENDYLLNLIG